LVIGALIFAVHAVMTAGQEPVGPRDRIVVSPGRIAQLAEVFTKTWQRPPTANELKGLIDAFVKEEVYYREAVKRGLDRDDTIIRRRMQQKMEFLTEPGDEALKASDDELEAFLAANRDAFRVETRVAFDQIFIGPGEAAGGTAVGPADEAAGADILREVRAAPPGTDFRQFGRPTMLPASLRLVALSQVDRSFGKGFGEEVARLPEKAWSGPVRSTYGLHLVRLTERVAGYDPPLGEVRQGVETKWRTAKREEFRQAEYQRLRDQYEVVLPEAAAPTRARETAR
jgi:hypothetical protein